MYVGDSAKTMYESVHFVEDALDENSELLSVLVKSACTDEHQRVVLDYSFFHRMRDLMSGDASSYDPDKVTFEELGSEAYVAVWILTRDRWSVANPKEYNAELEKVVKSFVAKGKQLDKLTVKHRDPKNPSKTLAAEKQVACPQDKVLRTKWFKDVVQLLNQPKFFLMFVSLDQFARYFDPVEAPLWFGNKTRVQDSDGKMVRWKDVMAKVCTWVTSDCLRAHRTYDSKLYQTNLDLLMQIRTLSGRLVKALVGIPYIDRPISEGAVQIANLRKRAPRDVLEPMLKILFDLHKQSRQPSTASEEQQRTMYNVTLTPIVFSGGTMNHQDMSVQAIKYIESQVKRSEETSVHLSDKAMATNFRRAIRLNLEGLLRDTKSVPVNQARRTMYDLAQTRIMRPLERLEDDIQVGVVCDSALQCRAKLQQPAGDWVLVHVMVNQTMFVAAQVANRQY